MAEQHKHDAEVQQYEHEKPKIEAVTQFVAYSERCRSAFRREADQFSAVLGMAIAVAAILPSLAAFTSGGRANCRGRSE